MTSQTDKNESDRRAALAFLWTLITAAIAGIGLYLSYLGTWNVENVIAMVSPFLALDGVFINSYFKGKETQ